MVSEQALSRHVGSTPWETIAISQSWDRYVVINSHGYAALIQMLYRPQGSQDRGGSIAVEGAIVQSYNRMMKLSVLHRKMEGYHLFDNIWLLI